MSMLDIFGSLVRSGENRRMFDEARDANIAALEDIQGLQRGMRERVLGPVSRLGEQLTRSDRGQFRRFAVGSREFRAQQEGGFRARTQLGERRSAGIVGGFEEMLGFGAGEQAGILGEERGRAAFGEEGIAGILGGERRRFAFGQRGGAAITAGFRGRRSGIMQRLRGLGGQEARDINLRFANLGARTSADLTSRGLGGTTIRQSMARGVERERGESLGRLGERLRREEIGLDVGLSGDVLAAQERGLGRNLGLAGDVLGRRESGLQTSLGLRADVLGRRQGGLQNVLGLREGVLGALQDQRGFGAGLSGEQLAGGFQAGAFDITGRQGGFERMLQRRQGFGIMGPNLDVDLTRGQIGTIERVNRPFPAPLR